MENNDLIEALVSGGMDIHSARRKARMIEQRKKVETEVKAKALKDAEDAAIEEIRKTELAHAKAKKTKPEPKE